MDTMTCLSCPPPFFVFESVIALLIVGALAAGYVIGRNARRRGDFSRLAFILSSLTIAGAVVAWIQLPSVHLQVLFLAFLVGLFRHSPEPLSLSLSTKSDT